MNQPDRHIVIFQRADVERDVPGFVKNLLHVFDAVTTEIEADGSAKVTFVGENARVDEIVAILATSRRGVLLSKAPETDQ